MAKRSPNPTDKHIGARVRMRRLMLDMSQTQLGDALGITFQQVQKYEKGTNRIGAGRLQQIANITHVPVSFFFEGAPSVPGHKTITGAQSPADLTDFMATSDGLRLAQAFMKIKSAKLHLTIVRLANEIVGTE